VCRHIDEPTTLARIASVRRANLANNLKPTTQHLINLDVVVRVGHDVTGRSVAHLQVNGHGIASIAKLRGCLQPISSPERVGCHEAATRMFDNVQTLNAEIDMLIIGLAPLIAPGLERHFQEGHEHG
jgi:hypothetical protein